MTARGAVISWRLPSQGRISDVAEGVEQPARAGYMAAGADRLCSCATGRLASGLLRQPFVHGLMAMMQAEGFSRLPPALDTMLQAVLPFPAGGWSSSRGPHRSFSFSALASLASGRTWPVRVALLLLWAGGTGGPGRFRLTTCCGSASGVCRSCSSGQSGGFYGCIEKLYGRRAARWPRGFTSRCFLAAGSGAALWPQPITGELLTAPVVAAHPWLVSDAGER